MLSSRRIRIVLPLVCAALAAGALAADWWTALPEGRQAEYVGRQTCARCHAAENKAWLGSDHDLAMDHATDETVLGDFNNREFVHHGVTSQMYRDGEKFVMATDGADGQVRPYEIKYTFGVRPLQQYLVEMDGGRIQALPVAWDTEQQRWFHVYGNEPIPHDDVLHWTRPAQNWNYMCAECHSTDVQKNFDLAKNEYRTDYKEIDVSCETCHGPGSLHVELAQGHSLFWDRRYGQGLATLAGGSSQQEIDTCARCHARRQVVHPGFNGGEVFLDHYRPELLDGELYHCDGQILEEDYEYGSFLQSRMYREGVRCTDCHDPHSTRLKFEGNKLCTRCHTSGKYDAPAHHRHLVGSVGSQCVECHMPAKNYMLVDPRRDHSIRVPRPDLSVELGVPNACNGCHKEKDAAWARDRVAEWFPNSKHRRPHFAQAIAAGRAGMPEGESLLVDVLKPRPTTSPLAARELDPGPIVRASAAALLGRYATPAAREAVHQALVDNEPLVRLAAVEQFSADSPDEARSRLGPMLRDPVRTVRMAAARALSALPRADFNAADRAAFDAALLEWFAGQQENADQPGAHLNMAVVWSNQGNVEQARKEYAEALRLDPSFTPALTNLGLLDYNSGDVAAAEKRFRRAIELAPEAVEAHYNLAMLVGEDESRLAEACALFGEAALLAPDHPRIRYNHGLALLRLSRTDAAAAELLAAADLAPQDGDIAQALAALASQFVQLRRWDDALRCANRLVEIDPRSAPLIDEIRRRMTERQPVGPQAPSGR